MTRQDTPNLDYVRKLFAQPDALLSAIDEQLRRLNVHMHVSAVEGRLLQWLVAARGIKTIVEVGTLAGYSALWMARALPQDGHLYTIDKEPKHIDMAKHFFDQSELKSRITLLEGDAHAALAQLESKAPFDMIFIDADKGAYNDYLDWAEKHVRKGGLIVADNTFLFGSINLDPPPEGVAPATWKAMRRFNERLSDRARYDATIIPTQEGLTVAVKLF